jgi:iron uptake system EfeUOB component EfeO/EfeM
MARGKPTSTEKREQVKALLYLNPDLSSKDISRETGVPDRTVRDILREAMKDDDTFAEYRQQKKKEQIVKALDIASKYIDHLANPDVIKAAKAKDSAIVAGTMIDKAQLLAGEPTQITERKEPTPELVSELEKKVSQLKQLTG